MLLFSLLQFWLHVTPPILMALIQVRVLSNHAIYLVHSEIDKVMSKKHVLNLNFMNFIKYMFFFMQIYISVLNALYHVVFNDSCKISQIRVYLILGS